MGLVTSVVALGTGPKSLWLFGKLSTTELCALCQIYFLNLAHTPSDLSSPSPLGAQVY